MTNHTDMERKELPTPAKPSLYGRARFFFRRYVVHGRVRIFLQWLFAKFQSLFIQPTILPYFITFFPYRRTSYSYKLPKAKPPRVPGQAAHPPEHLWLGYGKTIEEWLGLGPPPRRHDARHPGRLRVHVRSRRPRPGDGLSPVRRMLRCLEDVADRCEIWGTDISGEHIIVVQAALERRRSISASRPQHAHMPFADGYFDLIYAGVGVHAHRRHGRRLDARAAQDSEARRANVYHHPRQAHDSHAHRRAERQPRQDAQLSPRTTSRRATTTCSRSAGSCGRRCSTTPAYLSSRWKPFFDVQVHPGAAGFQTAYLFQKRP